MQTRVRGRWWLPKWGIFWHLAAISAQRETVRTSRRRKERSHRKQGKPMTTLTNVLRLLAVVAARVLRLLGFQPFGASPESQSQTTEGLTRALAERIEREQLEKAPARIRAMRTGFHW